MYNNTLPVYSTRENEKKISYKRRLKNALVKNNNKSSK